MTELNWIENPILYSYKIHAENIGKEDKDKQIFKFFNDKLQSDESSNQVPVLSSLSLKDIKNGQLVKFRCQIQDELGEEYFNLEYKVEDSEKNIRHCSGLFRDVLQCKEGETLIEESYSDNSGLSTRYGKYCISLPGTNDWVLQKSLQSCPTTEPQGKRPLDSEQAEESSKRARLSPTPGAPTPPTAAPLTHTSPNHPLYNHPFPDPHALACHAYFYSEEELPVNSSVELLGAVVLAPADPALLDAALGPASGRGLKEGTVPRLHVLAHRPLRHPHPTLPPSAPPCPPAEARETHELLRTALETLLLGDRLAAEYVIAALMGDVYAKQDVVKFGQFPLNLSGVAPSQDLPRRLYALLQRLSTNCYMLPLTVDNLNTMLFAPTKEPSSEHLAAGLLQLPQRFLLLVDETAMAPGQLNERGVTNLQQLRHLVANQEVRYQFPFNTVIDMDANVNVIVLSEGKSLITGCTEVPLRCPNTDVAASEAVLGDLLGPEALVAIRGHLATARDRPFELGEAKQQLEDDFVEARKADKKAFTAESFHQLLVLSRLVCLATGRATLCGDTWQLCRSLEAERGARVAALKRPPANLQQMSL